MLRHPGPALACALIVTVSACGRLPNRKPDPIKLWLVTTSIVIDSATLRPLPGEPAVDRQSARVSSVTTFQGSRYHPETVHALTDDPEVLGKAAGSIAQAVSLVSEGAFIDFQGAHPDELRSVTAMARAFADSARAHSISPIGILVPPSDTVAFPTSVFARSMDYIVLKLGGEHRPGTSSGPPASPNFITRQIGIRSREIGSSRLIIDIPLSGFIWDRNGTASVITFAAAQSRIAAESGSFTRDATTGYLTAAGREGWTLWVPDARTIETIIATARNSGVSRVALSNLSGSAPDVAAWIQSTLKR
jgi:hypothetical protein